jgi:hypothetical protein
MGIDPYTSVSARLQTRAGTGGTDRDDADGLSGLSASLVEEKCKCMSVAPGGRHATDIFSTPLGRRGSHGDSGDTAQVPLKVGRHLPKSRPRGVTPTPTRRAAKVGLGSLGMLDRRDTTRAERRLVVG